MLENTKQVSKLSEYAVLTPEDMTIAEQQAVEQKTVKSSFELMQRAGKAVAEAANGLICSGDRIAVLCGTGNNGGDGYIAAKILSSKGYNVTCFLAGKPDPKKDAALAEKDWNGKTKPLSQFQPSEFELLIDAMLGAGLDRPVNDELAQIIDRVNASNLHVLAVDLPSGIAGATGEILGSAFQATITVTFFRKKIGHLLYPGRANCGEVIVADIGIPANALADVHCQTFHNGPEFWLPTWPELQFDSHKYNRGHVAIFSGPRHSSGAARLSAWASARVGAGAVTLIADADTLDIHAAHVTSIMLHQKSDTNAILSFLQRRKVRSCVIGPGFEKISEAVDFCQGIISSRLLNALIIDADAITAYAKHASLLFQATRNSSTSVILTPHEGEFARLFPDLAESKNVTRLEKAKKAAERANATVIYKGADTIIASPCGFAAINSNGTPLLATAGSGDVLSGLVAGLVAQKMDTFFACCAAVWIHACAAHLFGYGLIAEDIIAMIPDVLSALQDEQKITRYQLGLN